MALCQDYVFQTNGSTLYHDLSLVPRQLRGSLPLPVLRPGPGKADGGQASERAAGAAARRLGEDRPRCGRGGGAILLGDARSHREDAPAAV